MRTRCADRKRTVSEIKRRPPTTTIIRGVVLVGLRCDASAWERKSATQHTHSRSLRCCHWPEHNRHRFLETSAVAFVCDVRIMCAAHQMRAHVRAAHHHHHRRRSTPDVKDVGWSEHTAQRFAHTFIFYHASANLAVVGREGRWRFWAGWVVSFVLWRTAETAEQQQQSRTTAAV